MEAGRDWTSEDYREFWAGFEHDEEGNVVLRDPMPDELRDAVMDPEIQAIVDRFESMRTGNWREAEAVDWH